MTGRRKDIPMQKDHGPGMADPGPNIAYRNFCLQKLIRFCIHSVSYCETGGRGMSGGIHERMIEINELNKKGIESR